jgi:hypothetical protein
MADPSAMSPLQDCRNSDPGRESDGKEVPRCGHAQQDRRDACDYEQQPAHIPADMDLVHRDSRVPKISFHDALLRIHQLIYL